MLQDKYLPTYQFSEHHARVIKSGQEKIWPLVAQMDFSGSWIIRMLFALRGMPARMMTLEGLDRARFICLEKKEHDEIAIGLIGQFWRPNGNLQKFIPAEFTPFHERGFCKAVWTFRLVSQGPATTLLETETRIFCTDQKALTKFSRYWLFIKPFSGLIRNEILRGIKNKAEQSG